MVCHTLDPAMPVLLRPDGTVQVGWDPRRAVLVQPPNGLSCSALADLLRAMQDGVSADNLAALASAHGLADIGSLISALTAAGVLRTDSPDSPPRERRSAAIRIHGRGPLSDLLAGALRCSGSRVATSRLGHATVSSATTDLVVLSDFLVADPRLVRELQAARVPHLPVRIRDGVGLIGPLVLPGATSCLNCADLHRGDRDAAWPAVAAQLQGAVGTADRATVLATAAVALDQVNRVVDAIRGGRRGDEPPPTLNATLEFDVGTRTTVVRRWTRHPRCSCG
jgi:bacteriocin biosynthesis cyclodehydratase domain-containing protein